MPFKKDLDKESTTIRRKQTSKEDLGDNKSSTKTSNSKQSSSNYSPGKGPVNSGKSYGDNKGAASKAGSSVPPKKKQKEKGKVGKAVDKVKKTLPKKRIIEDETDFRQRNSRMSPSTKKRGQSRREYVTEQKNTGGKYTPRIEEKKGWGSKAPVKKRKLAE